MQYQAKVKFFASLNADGDIVPGAAAPGFKASDLSSDEFGVYHCLLEDTLSDAWELWRYDATSPSGSRRSRLYSSDPNNDAVFFPPKTALTCSLVAHPNSYVLNTHVRLADTPSVVLSVDATSVGPQADIGTNCRHSLAINGTVRDDSPRSVCIGGWAGGGETVSIGFEAKAENVMDMNTYGTINAGTSVAIGYRAQATAGGEVALGSANASHMSGIPVMTDNPAAGGTFLFKSVAGYNTDTYQYVLADLLTNNQAYTPQNTASGPEWVIHVQGTIVARADNAANGKVVKVEWVTGGTLVQTVLTQGANNISLGLALNDMRLQATVAAVAGLKLAGYLHVTKISLKNY